MSIVSISYSSLKDASREAEDVARKLDKYADSLYSDVYKKLNNYDGPWSSHVSSAKTNTNNKINELRLEQEKYESYAKELINLRDECVRVDKAVKSKVSSLTASFKEAYGIRNSAVENAINYFVTGLNNKTSFGRWISSAKDDYEAGKNYLKDSIKEWYNYKGGKELIVGTLVGLIEVAIGVLAIAGAILSGGALVAVIAGVVGGIIAIANGAANIWNEQKAYSITRNGDPATGKRRSEINTWQDYLRSSFIFGDDGETYEYNEFYNGLALGIDIVDKACAVVDFVCSGWELLQKGYKWATGSFAKIDDIKLNQVFSKDTFGAFKTKFKDAFIDIKKSFKTRGWEAAKDMGSSLFKNFGDNLKNEFWNFFDKEGKFDVGNTLSSIKNMLGVPKDLLSDGFSLSNIAKIGFNEILLKGLTATTVYDAEVKVNGSQNGLIKVNVKISSDPITIDTIVGIFKDGGEIGSFIKNMICKDSIINLDVMNKMNTSCDLNISMPETYIPSTDIPVLRTDISMPSIVKPMLRVA